MALGNSAVPCRQHPNNAQTLCTPVAHIAVRQMSAHYPDTVYWAKDKHVRTQGAHPEAPCTFRHSQPSQPASALRGSQQLAAVDLPCARVQEACNHAAAPPLRAQHAARGCCRAAGGVSVRTHASATTAPSRAGMAAKANCRCGQLNRRCSCVLHVKRLAHKNLHSRCIANGTQRAGRTLHAARDGCTVNAGRATH